MKKQVYKVGDRVKIIHCESGESFSKRHNGQIGVIKHIWIEGYRKGWVSILLPNNECCITSKVSPLKPQKSIKKRETKVQELERRIKALEAHRCNPVPQPTPLFYPNSALQQSSYCRWCALPVGLCRGHTMLI